MLHSTHCRDLHYLEGLELVAVPQYGKGTVHFVLVFQQLQISHVSKLKDNKVYYIPPFIRNLSVQIKKNKVITRVSHILFTNILVKLSERNSST